LLNVAAFYTGVVAAAITEQLHKVRDWIKPPSCFSTLAELCIPSASVSLVKCILQTTGPSQIRVSPVLELISSSATCCYSLPFLRILHLWYIPSNSVSLL
jgi:hypothetical protein